MNLIYTAHELRQEIWEDVKTHIDECDCVLCKTIDVISEYLGD